MDEVRVRLKKTNKAAMQETIAKYLKDAGKQIEDDFVLPQQDYLTLAMNIVNAINEAE